MDILAASLLVGATTCHAFFIGAGREAGVRPAVVAKSVVNAKDVAKAEWRVSGLGVFVPSVNGTVVKSVPGEVLMPGYTHFTKRRHEITIDATAQWNRAAGATNRLSALVTAGWWCDGIAGKSGGTWPAFRGVMTLAHTDGTLSVVPTDDSWLVTTNISTTSSGIWEGVEFDSRPTDAGWTPAKTSDEFGGEVSARIGPPVALRGDLRMAGGEFRLEPGETKVFDFGQNCAAVPALHVKGEAGTKVSVRLGEMLNDGIRGHHGDGPAGSVYLANMRRAKAGFDYICNGGETREFMPETTFFGYRYAAVSADGHAEGRIDSIPVSSVSREMERGTVVTGREDVNRLVQNARWSMLSNYLSIPTDCPQRTERYGWTGDAQVFAKTGAYFADIAGFMRKWMQDVRDTQHDDGMVPVVCPRGSFGESGPTAGWSDAAVIVPWTMWKYLGDADIVRENWSAMAKYLMRIAKNGFTSKRGQWLLCDWLSFERLSVDNSTRWSNGGYTEDHLSYQNYLNACHLLQDVRMMAEMGKDVSGLPPVPELPEIEARTRERILSTWFKADGTLSGPFDRMQTPALFALKLGLGNRERLASALVAAIHANGDRLATGFLGTPILCEVLSDIGESELAYTLLLQHEFPSWLYSVDQGATTIWERWNGYTKEKGFGPVGMNSFNHYAYGAVVGWLFERAAGIQPAAHGGWRRFVIAPEPDRRLGRLSASLRTEFGTIESAWSFDGSGTCQINVTVPPGTSALVKLPDGTSFDAQSGVHARTITAKNRR